MSTYDVLLFNTPAPQINAAFYPFVYLYAISPGLRRGPFSSTVWHGKLYTL